MHSLQAKCICRFTPFLLLAFVTFGAAQTPLTPKAVAQSNTDTLTLIEWALESGDLERADSLHSTLSPQSRPPSWRHRHEIVKARLAASRGDWRAAEKALRAWNQNSARTGGSGEVLFWLGWAAMHQAKVSMADSLLVLASAYTEESRAQQALEYRLNGLLENGPSLQHYLRGLPESPLPLNLRRQSLHQIPTESQLYAHARWHLMVLHALAGESVEAAAIMDTLSRFPQSIPGKRAIAYKAYLSESMAPDTALTLYEFLLMQQQQGVTAEFARKRLQALRAEKSGRQGR
jgi:hypothetical protein